MYARARQTLTTVTSLTVLLASSYCVGDGPSRKSSGMLSRAYYNARALFEKVWVPGELSPAGGDGIGPLFNERSCVGCHSLGGTGGAGDSTKDVTILSALKGASISGNRQATVYQGDLEDLHPGFRNRSSIVLHNYSTSAEETGRLRDISRFAFVQTRDDMIALSQSRRSTPALFGAGRIDSIPDKALLDAEARTFPEFSEVKGRVSRLRDGRLGKFGWKGQTASLEDFVMAACANELGLEVRGHHQPSLLSSKEFDKKKFPLDLSDDDTAQLIRFVANLPQPASRPNGAAGFGLGVFVAIGCATCHAHTMGSVSGIYSDLLLHDLGDRFRAFGGGYGSPISEVVDHSKNMDARARSGDAGPTEWRTTPLWGVADSAPYLHDGRASTIHEAIILHGGEAESSSNRYRALSPEERTSLLAFLNTLIAPDQPGRPVDRTSKTSRAKRR